MEFYCRVIHYQGFQRVIVLQDQNGPCPLIALANILSMRGLISLMPLVSQDRGVISQIQLTNEIASYVVANLSSRRNHAESNERYLHDILESIPKIVRGLDINLKFTDIFSYEPTVECDIFDVCAVSIVHGMVVDEADVELAKEVGSSSYNIMIEAMTEGKAPHFAAWIQEQPTMLSWKGLFELSHKLQEDQLYCLFRNNHYSILTRHNNVLFTLVTDVELARAHPSLPWESLVDCDGSATTFIDCYFGSGPPRAPLPRPPLRIVEAQPITQPVANETTVVLVEDRNGRVADRRPPRRTRQSNTQNRGQGDECCCML